MYENHQAIYALYPQAVRIDEGIGAFDANGIAIALDASAIATKAAELATEKAWTDLRTERNKLLAATDWEIVRHKELGTNIPTALKTYRQELRDLPANTSDPANPSWPVKP
tara:strand:+ start:1112 stop:1444 length:333 start_codon:yes stop_codon:yes gene_type:complete